MSNENVTSINKLCVCGKRKEIVNPAAMNSLAKIANCNSFEPGYLKQITAVVKEVYDAIRIGESELQEKYKTLAKKDAHGQPILTADPNNPGVQLYDFETPENKVLAENLYKDAMEAEIKLSHRPKLYLEKLLPAKLTPNDLINLEYLINDEK